MTDNLRTQVITAIMAVIRPEIDMGDPAYWVIRGFDAADAADAVLPVIRAWMLNRAGDFGSREARSAIHHLASQVAPAPKIANTHDDWGPVVHDD